MADRRPLEEVCAAKGGLTTDGSCFFLVEEQLSWFGGTVVMLLAKGDWAI